MACSANRATLRCPTCAPRGGAAEPRDVSRIRNVDTMRDLFLYEQAFDSEYPKYATDPYAEISALTECLNEPGTLQDLRSTEFKRLIKLVTPIIAIKNYKSQVPFPRKLTEVLEYAIAIKQCTVPDTPLTEEPKRLFLALIEQEGFQLPTVSALFHFCHPSYFPIVDRNVEVACALLKDSHASDFEEYDAPRLPVATTSAENKAAKYRSFIKFIDRVRTLHDEQHGGTTDYRFVDKALMVLGVEKMRRHAENAGGAC